MENKITVTSAGTVINANVTPDSTMYYSNKSKEWAISEKLIDNEDYSSKHYANESKKQADISTAKTTEVVASGNTAVSNIESARDNVIMDVNTAGVTQISDVNTAGATQIANVNSAGATQINLAKEQVTLATNQANIATEQATIATNKTSEVVASGNEVLSNIDTAKNGAITDITNLKNTSISNITTAKNNAITSITNQETTSKNNVITTGNEQVDRVNLTGVDNRTPIFTKSEIGTNEGVYQNVYDLKHSTFDLSKFTVVGSPTITDEGVASGFSSANYINTNYNFDDLGSDFEIVVKATVPTTQTVDNVIIGTSESQAGIRAIITTAKKLWCSLGTTDSGWDIVNAPSDLTITQNEFYVKVSYNGTTYKFDISYDGNTWTNFKSVTSSKLLNVGTLYFGTTYNSNNYCEGSIDLKQFSITGDGKEVFSGNKTGIDQIKKDDYTIVGSPIISNDGIASGFSINNYLYTSYNYGGLATNCEINIKFTTGSSFSSGGNVIGQYSRNRYFPELGVNTSKGLDFLWSSDGSSWGEPFNFNDLKENTTYYFKAILENGILEVGYSEDNINWVTQSKSTNTISLNDKVTIGCDSNTKPFTGSIDLNSFKIYVDGNLVYQPCLKIPYTLSKTGSKIVDVAYRDRVIDLYEQEGQAGYYTIDEENKNFTLPMGEIYGMIGQRSLISSTVTETNRVDIYSDKTCLIYGSVATVGTINLPIELVNNNYFITLPTSAKTATSFTTTATGDYILIGKVI